MKIDGRRLLASVHMYAESGASRSSGLFVVGMHNRTFRNRTDGRTDEHTF